MTDETDLSRAVDRARTSFETEQQLAPERARALLALEIERKRREGLSFAEIAALLSTPARPLTRNAVLGIAKRLEIQRANDARDLRILSEIADKSHPLGVIAKTYDVSAQHVVDLKREAGL